MRFINHIPLYFIAAPSTPARRPSAERFFLKRELEQDRTAHINGILATSHPMSHSIHGRNGVIGTNPEALLPDSALSVWIT